MSNTCDEEVFNEIFLQLADDLHSFVRHKFGTNSDPADIVQEAFTALWNNCHKVPSEKAKSYLFTVANNKSLKEIRKSKTANRYVISLSRTQEGENPHDQLEEHEFKERLNKALNEMPEKQRVAFMLNRVERKRHKEIAEILNISQKAVEKRIYKGADFLFTKLGKKI